MKLVDDFNENLSSPIASFRVSALGKLVSEGGDPGILPLLKERRNIESDPECLMLLEQAIACQEELSEENLPDGRPPVDLTVFPQLPATEKIRFLRGLNGNELPAVFSQAVQWLENEENSVIQALIMRTFQRKWTAEEAKWLVPFLRSPHLNTKLAAMEILIQVAPRRMIPTLPKLLLDSDPKTRSLAIQGLDQFDPQEAIRHLDWLLSHDDRRFRFCGLQNCLFLPFERTKPVLLNFLIRETDLGLLEGAGWLFEVNPDLEVPFKLWEITETAEKDKAEVLKKITNGACRAIESSGILGERFPEYLDRLKHWLNKRVANRRIQSFIARWISIPSPDEVRQEIRQVLLSPQTEWRDALKSSLRWDIPQKVKDLIAKALTGESPGMVTEAKKEFGEMSNEEKIRLISSLKPEQTTESLPHLQRVMNSPDSSPDLIAATIRTSLRLEIASMKADIKTCLKHKDDGVVAAALEYLGQVDPEEVLGRIGYFLQMKNQRIKGSAIRVLKGADPLRAVASIETLLGDKSPKQHELALACMFYFDFSMVRNALEKFLRRNDAFSHGQAEEFRNMGFSLFQANPDQENLYSLFVLEQTLSPAGAELARSTHAQNVGVLVELGILPAGEEMTRQKAWESRWKHECEKAREKPAAYSVEVLRKSESEVSFPEELYHWIGRNPLVLVALFGVLTFWLVTPGGDPTQGTGKSGAVLSSTIKIAGEVEKQFPQSGKILVRTKAGDGYVFKARNFGRKIIPKGTTCSASLTPFRRRKDGLIEAECLSLELRAPSSSTPKE